VPAFGALVAEPLYLLADTAVVGHLGTPQLAGLAVASTVLNAGYAVFIFLAYGTTAAVARLIGALGLDALAIAGQAMVGRLLGAGDAAAARAASRRLVELGIGLGIVFGAAVGALHEVLPHAFSDDPSVAALASFLLLCVAAMQPANAVVFVLDGVLMGAGDMRFLAVAMVGAVALFAVAGTVLLVTHAGIGWLWAAIGGLIVARLVALAGRMRTDRWLVLGPVC
jgi:Na+-driven multidrug efflux pump